MKTLSCGGYQQWTDYGYEYDCEYGSDVECSDCVCNGGDYDPRYNTDKQPYKLSKFILRTKEINIERIINEMKKFNKDKQC